MFCAGVGSAGGASEDVTAILSGPLEPAFDPCLRDRSDDAEQHPIQEPADNHSEHRNRKQGNDPRLGSDQYDTDDCENAARAEDLESEAASISTGEECSSEECDPHTDHSSIGGNSHRERDHRPEGNRYEAHA